MIFEALNNPNVNCTLYAGDDENFPSRVILRNHFPQLWHDITQMACYQKYKPYLDILYFLVHNKLTWHPKCSMQQAWGIVDKYNFSPKGRKIRDVGMNVIWHRYMANHNRITDANRENNRDNDVPTYDDL